MRRQERQLVSFDWAMKRLLKQKANYVVLEGFLSELLREDITIDHFADTVSNKSDEDDKYNCVDIIAENSKGEVILIEVQYDNEIDYFHRMLYGSSKLITDYLNAGDPYEKVKKVISVNLIYFDLGQGKDYIYWGRTYFTGMHFQDRLELSQKQKEHFKLQCVSEVYPEYYILKLNHFNDYATSALDEWVYTLKNGRVPDGCKAKGLKEAKEVLDIFNMTDEERADYERYQKQKHVQASVVTSSIIRAEEAEERAKVAGDKADEAEEKAKVADEKAEAAEEKAEAAEEKAEAAAEKAKLIAAEKLEAVTKLARQMKKYGESVADISSETGLSEQEIELL